MSDKPTVLINIRDGRTSCAINSSGEGNVKVLILNWDDLTETTSRGELCRAYKDIWALPEDLRASPLTELIGEVQRRFPILATFQAQKPQADEPQERSGHTSIRVWLTPDGAPVTFDVTEKLLLRGPDYIDNLRDRDYPVDDLADDLLDRQSHIGPFQVTAKEGAMEFLFADENEAGDAEKQKA